MGYNERSRGASKIPNNFLGRKLHQIDVVASGIRAKKGKNKQNNQNQCCHNYHQCGKKPGSVVSKKMV